MLYINLVVSYSCNGDCFLAVSENRNNMFELIELVLR